MNINKKDMIHCDHKNNESVVIDGKKFLECLDCGTQIPTEPISKDQLCNAVDICRDALNQLKAWSEDPESDSHIIEGLGQMAYELDILTFDKYGEVYKKLKENRNESINKRNV